MSEPVPQKHPTLSTTHSLKQEGDKLVRVGWLSFIPAIPPTSTYYVPGKQATQTKEESRG